jgi:hypothetical protein
VAPPPAGAGRRPTGKNPPPVPADRPFANPNFQPTEEGLEAALGDAIGRFDVIRGLAADFNQEWGFFRGSGWMMRVHDGRKSLLYLVPLRGSFRVSMAIREGERDRLAADPALAMLRSVVEEARKVPEGFAVAFDVDGNGDFGPLRSFIEKLVATRKADDRDVEENG